MSTRNRHRCFHDTLAEWRKHLPPNTTLIVVDDQSTPPIPNLDGATVIRHDYRRGIAMTKNRCISALMDAGCEHLFLADNDIWPISPHWWMPYVQSPEPHLSYQWINPAPNSQWRQAHNDGTHWSITFPRGVLLYATRHVIDTVGGMDPAYGMHGGEHVDWSRRIHRAGLTTWQFADVCGSHKLWYARDEHEGNTKNSTIPLPRRRKMCAANGALWHKTATAVPYREGQGEQDWQLGPDLTESAAAKGDPIHACLQHVLASTPTGHALEFGVGAGTTLRIIEKVMPVTGFDSFNGLPEKWRDGFDAGMFAGPPPRNLGAAKLKIGLFSDTLPTFTWPDHVGLVHIDCDLYSSTATVLEHVGPHLKPGTWLLFDEWHGYPGEEAHEQRAWREFAQRTGIGWTVVGHGPEQWLIRIT